MMALSLYLWLNLVSKLAPSINTPPQNLNGIDDKKVLYNANSNKSSHEPVL